MDTDLSTSLAVAQSTSTRHSVAIAVLKQVHEAERALVQMVDEVARSAPPPGQGKVVDKLA
jgi:hypothetical protein